MTKPKIIGEGMLTWNRGERVSDRYGAFYLLADADADDASGMSDKPVKYAPLDTKALRGKYGTLSAEVLQTFTSGHIGDLFRGLSPETPEVGETIVLGEGEFFTERDGEQLAIGLKPRDDERTYDWLDPKALYRTHSQVVRISFTEVPS